MYYSSKAEGARSAPPQSSPSSFLSPKLGHAVAGEERPELTTAQWLHRNIPRVPGMPWSAPLFDDRKPTSEPDIYCMVAVDEHRCICHSEQGTRLQIPYDQCTIIATVGVYNPYRAPASKLGREILQERQQAQADMRVPGESLLGGARVPRSPTVAQKH